MNTLNNYLFFFSVIVILFPVICISYSLLTYIKTKQKIFLYSTILVTAFIVDLVFLHYTDFYHSATVDLPTTYISLAPFKIILFSIMLASETLIVLEIFQKNIKPKYFLFIIAFIIIEVMFKIVDESNLSIWLFYTTRQLFSILLCGFFYYSYFRCHDLAIKTYAKKFYSIFAIVLLMNIIIGIEDALVISQQQAFSTSGLIFKERNFSENIYWMVITIIVFTYSTQVLKKLTLPSKNEEATSVKNVDLFMNDIQLTKREKEIFLLILQHLSNTEIADSLCISSGTLKAHIHNIYAKAEVTHRNELIKKVNAM